MAAVKGPMDFVISQNAVTCIHTVTQTINLQFIDLVYLHNN